MGALLLPLLLSFCDPVLATHGRLYDQRNQYFVTCRLDKEKRVEPFFGEDSVKWFYTWTDKDNIVITKNSNNVCEKQIQAPRGDKRDWRNRLRY